MRFWSLHAGEGPIPYDVAHELQRKLVDERARDLIPDTILLLEHEPVITRGRGLQFDPSADHLMARPRRMPLPAMIPPEIAVRDIERGGDLTFHEPGQLVVYPIVKLGDPHGFAPERDIARFLRRLEAAVIAALGEYGLHACTREHATGVWVERATDSSRNGIGSGNRTVSASDSVSVSDLGKIASIGIAVRRWVTYHGLAINAVNAMTGFRLISPCGFAPEVMVRLADLAPAAAGADWRARLERALATALGAAPEAEIERVYLREARAAALDAPAIGLPQS